MTPLVSVIIPTYNRREFLAEALESALAQTHDNLEIIVVDDGSNDGTGDYVRGLESDKVKYVYQENTGFPGAARNTGLKLAAGEFVAFLDSDDKWRPDKIKKQLRVFEKNPELDLVASDFHRLPAGPKTALRLRRNRPVVFRELLESCLIQNSSVMVRKSVVDAIGLQDETLRTSEDHEYWLRVLRRKDESGLIMAEPLSFYRLHSDNIEAGDVADVDRMITVVSRHRDYDPPYVDSLIQGLHRLKAYRQAQVDLAEGEASLAGALIRRRLGFANRLRLIKRRLQDRASR